MDAPLLGDFNEEGSVIKGTNYVLPNLVEEIVKKWSMVFGRTGLGGPSSDLADPLTNYSSCVPKTVEMP